MRCRAPVPDDEDPGVVLVEAVSVSPVVDLGRAHYSGSSASCVLTLWWLAVLRM